MPNQFPAGRDPLTEMVAALGRMHLGFGGFCTGTTDERGVCNSCGAQLAVPPPPPTSIQDDLAVFRQEATTIFERELATLRRRHGVRSERTHR